MEITEHADYTRHYIAEALFKLMEKKDFSEISITEIARKAGVGRATFYRNFTDKQSIVVYYFNRMKSRFNRSVQFVPRSEEDYYDLILMILRTLRENKETVKKLIDARLDSLLLEYLNEGFRADFLNSNKPQNEYLPYAYAGALYNITLAWVKNDCSDDIQTIAGALFIASFAKSRTEG